MIKIPTGDICMNHKIFMNGILYSSLSELQCCLFNMDKPQTIPSEIKLYNDTHNTVNISKT